MISYDSLSDSCWCLRSCLNGPELGELPTSGRAKLRSRRVNPSPLSAAD